MPSPKHNTRSAAQTRAWRLALLLTGAEDLAAEVAIQVRRAQPKLDALDPRRLDRLTVLRSREVVRASARHASRAPTSSAPDAAADAPPPAAALLTALAALEEQPREAWIFARLDNLDPVEVARSMDCSKTATARFLTEAEVGIARAFRASAADRGSERSAPPPADPAAPPPANDESPPAPATRPPDPTTHLPALRAWLDSLSPYESIEARLAIHRRRKRLWLGLWLLLAAAITTAALLAYAILA